MSLLTQFYPGPGGGGGTSPGAASGAYVYTEGQRSPWASVGNISATGAFQLLSSGNTGLSLAGAQGTGDKVTFVGMRIQLSPSNNIEVNEISLSSSTLYLDAQAAQPNLTTISGSGACIEIRDALASNVYSNLVSISTDISFVASWDYSQYIVTGSKLNATTVNHILTSLVATGATGLTSGTRTVNFSGGTSAGNSALTAAGLAAKNALVAAGWAVTLN